MSTLSLKVSNSEALSLGCERKHMYAFHPGYHLEPNYQSLALIRGNVGHLALEQAFTVIMEGGTLLTAAEKANASLIKSMGEAMAAEDTNKITAVTQLLPLISEYMKSDGLKQFLDAVIILGVERGFTATLPNGTLLPGRMDLLVKYIKTSWKGETVIVDNKFVYNFWTEDDYRLNSQFPSYGYGLKQEMPDIVLRRGLVNQIRWRQNAVEKFQMTPIPITKIDMAAVIANHALLAKRAILQRSKPLEEIRATATRMMSKYTCEKCSFKTLCKSELVGNDVTDLIKMDYRPNSYGYDGVNEVDQLDD